MSSSSKRAAWGIGAALLAIIAPLVLLLAMPAPSHRPTTEVHDEAGVLQVPSFTERIAQTSFWQPTHVAVLTLPDLEGRTLNDAVLRYARTQQTDTPWINQDDPNYWADGLFILAVAPNERLVGTYSGEDIAVGLGQQAEIQDATKDLFRRGDWAGGLKAGVDSAGSIMGRPWFASEVISILAGVMIAGGAAWLLVVAIRRARTARMLSTARSEYAAVTQELDTIELTAGTIPRSGPHSAEIDRRFRQFEQGYFAVTKEFNSLGTPSQLDMLSTATRNRARALETETRALRSAGISIVKAGDFLGMSAAWREAWTTELGPVYEDLQALDKFANRKLGKTDPDVIAGARSTVAQSQEQLDRLTLNLEARRMEPEQALHELDAISGRIHIAADRLAVAALEATGSDKARAKALQEWDDIDWDSRPGYSGSWRTGSGSGTYRPGSTIRPTPDTLGWSGSRSASQMHVPVASLVVGYSAAVAAATGSSSGSSGSGSSSFSGGFSGSGSSSSF